MTSSAEATLSNWDGHFTVENTTSSLLPLNTENYNGYSATEKQTNEPYRAASNHWTDCSNNEYLQDFVKDAGTKSFADERRRDRGGAGGHSQLLQQIERSSSLATHSMAEIVMSEDLQSESEPTSAILDYCQRKFLRPYVILLSLVGLNPISTDTTFCRSCLNYLQAFLILSLLIFGYILEYLCSYRGDRGFAIYHKLLPTKTKGIPDTDYEDCADPTTIGELVFGYIIPNALHIIGYISAIIVSKVIDNEQLQNLIERVFLVSINPKRLCRILWAFVSCGFILLSILFICVVMYVLCKSPVIHVKWLMEALMDWKVTTKITLITTIFIQDLVEIIILCSYCIECYLLRVHLTTLSQKLLMHSIESLDWMREVLEFRKLLDHLNHRVAVPVCFYIVMNISYALAGLVYFFKDFDFNYSSLNVVILNIINVLLWMLMGFCCFFMAASVTKVCQRTQATGHQIRVRPFVYHNTSSEDLNSTLLFASSLEMSAKLFHMPIQWNYLCFAILVLSVVIITLGMCLNLSVLGFV